jgi:hypothetical protein
MVVNFNRERVQVELDQQRLSKLSCFALESKEVQVLAIGMPEVSETGFNATTNLEGGKNKRDKGQPHFACYLVLFY